MSANSETAEHGTAWLKVGSFEKNEKMDVSGMSRRCIAVALYEWCLRFRSMMKVGFYEQITDRERM